MPDGRPSDAGAERGEARRVIQRAAVVVGGYFVYAALAMTLPGHGAAPDAALGGGLAGEGQRVWLANNCQSCHSLFGLGGHTGPDLTNVTARRGREYVRGAVRVGLPGMPRIDLDDADARALAAFLEQVNATGVYPPNSLRGPVFGERR